MLLLFKEFFLFNGLNFVFLSLGLILFNLAKLNSFFFDLLFCHVCIKLDFRQFFWLLILQKFIIFFYKLVLSKCFETEV
jgi:hypothetical protein